MPQDLIPSGSMYPVQLRGEMGSRERTTLLLVVFLRWWRLILCLTLVFSVAAGMAAFLEKPRSKAIAKILLKEDRTPLQISGLGSRGKSQYSVEALQSEIELLKSREVMLPAAKELLRRQHQGLPRQQSGGLEQLRIFLEKTKKRITRRIEAYLSGGEEPPKKDEVDKIEAKAASLTGKTVAVPVKGTNVIQVSYFAPTPAGAVGTLDVIVDRYLEQHAEAFGGSSKLLSFYEYEQKRVEAELRAAEEQLEKWQKTHNIVSLDDQLSSQTEMLASLERSLRGIEVEEKKSFERDPVMAKIRSDLVSAEIALEDLLQRYTDDDRRVREKRELIALIRQRLAAAEDSWLASLASQRDTLRRQRRETAIASAALRGQKLEFERLSRIVDLHKDAFLLYGKKLEEARIAASLEREQLSNVAVIERPHALPAGRQVPLSGVALLAAMVGFVLGAAIAFGCEFLNNTVRTPEDIERHLELPVLAAIPDLRR